MKQGPRGKFCRGAPVFYGLFCENAPMATSRRRLIAWLIGGFIVLIAAFSTSTYLSISKIMDRVDGDHKKKFKSSGDIAVIKITGEIMASESLLERIDEVSEMDSLKAVVFRINSPGGAVGPSQEIYDAVKRLSKTKKTVCSFGDLAASGAYYIASACDKIVANAGTLTGSIGVIMHFYNLKDLMAWAKVKPVVVKSGLFKDIGSESRDMTDAERALLQKMINNVYSQFKRAVAEGRHLEMSAVDKIATGEVFSGEQAIELGLVDRLGAEFEAIDEAKTLAGIKGKPKVIREFEGRSHRTRAFFNDSGDEDSSYTGKGLSAELRATLGRVLPPLRLEPGIPYLLPSYYVGGQP